jgi:hypothetical protein
MNKYFAAVGIAIVITGFTIIQSNQSMHQGDPDNGELFLPYGFVAKVVIDSVGSIRHIAVNSNGDIYAKLRTSRPGQGGAIAMLYRHNDGKVDSIVKFGGYKVRSS